MKTYEVEVKRVTYITYTVEATTLSEAAELAFEKAEQDYPKGDYELNSIVETE